MTVVVGEDVKMAEYSENQKLVLPHEYGCEILLEKTTLSKAKDPSFPSDAYLIWYIVLR
jgi:hypothetical protein